MILIDLHCHTQEHSFDSTLPAAEFAAHVAGQGFSGMVLTDHEYLWPDEELAELRAQAGLPKSFLLLSGQEVRTAVEGIVYGDILVYGARHSFPDGTHPTEIFRHLHETGGFAIAAHPAATRWGMGEKLGSFPVLAAETWNGRYGARMAEQSAELAKRFQLPTVGGSDAHCWDDAAGGGTLFPTQPRNLDDMATMIREGKVIPWKPGQATQRRGLLGRLWPWTNAKRGD